LGWASPDAGVGRDADETNATYTTLTQLNRYWRSRRDSNPRYAFTAYNGLANHRLQPLGHSSVLLRNYCENLSNVLKFLNTFAV
jgi:hypothetical protein